MKRVERYKVMRVVGAIGVALGIVLASHAFDIHNRPLMFGAIALVFASMIGLASALRHINGAELVMSDAWEPHDRFNPYTGLPMVDGTLDIHGNLYGTHSNEDHRRGG